MSIANRNSWNWPEIAAMSESQFEAWLQREGLTGLGAAAASRKRRRIQQEEAEKARKEAKRANRTA